MPSADTTLVLLSVKSLRGVSICRRLVGETLNTNVRFFSNLYFLLIAIEGLVDVRFLLKEEEFQHGKLRCSKQLICDTRHRLLDGISATDQRLLADPQIAKKHFDLSSFVKNTCDLF